MDVPQREYTKSARSSLEFFYNYFALKSVFHEFNHPSRVASCQETDARRGRHFRGIKRRSCIKTKLKRAFLIAANLVYLPGRFSSLVFRLDCSVETEEPFPGQSRRRTKRAARRRRVERSIRLFVYAFPLGWSSAVVAPFVSSRLQRKPQRGNGQCRLMMWSNCSHRGESGTPELSYLSSHSQRMIIYLSMISNSSRILCNMYYQIKHSILSISILSKQT